MERPVSAGSNNELECCGLLLAGDRQPDCSSVEDPTSLAF